ncbi:RNA-binding protein [uncultured Prochlorococcus sp.]|uniref:RNA recognition motif domain-containing protein n=1 Tax=uncultured Prochlorococcus sp. TaxID=159733 RepID=UPI00258C6764|nr:RNA-binding protein [uncultured Prochlorococcus sp.]
MSIFVGNLPFRAEREDVIQLFAPFGEVQNCSLPLERDTGRKRGFAFIEMVDEATESTAIDGLQGTELMGRPLRINKAEPRGSGGSRRGGRGGYGGGNNGSNSSNANKSSGAEGWEDRSYGNSSENSEYENGRSRRKRGVSNDSNASNETN